MVTDVGWGMLGRWQSVNTKIGNNQPNSHFPFVSHMLVDPGFITSAPIVPFCPYSTFRLPSSFIARTALVFRVEPAAERGVFDQDTNV